MLVEITNGLRDAVNKYKSGDMAAFTDIYNESHKYIYVCVYNVMNGNDNKDDMIQDIMQDTYVEISKHLDSLENVDRFLSWAGTIATRKCYEVIKKSGKYVLLGEDETFDNISDDDNIIPEEIMQNKEKQRLLREIIQNELTEMQKLCVVGFFYNDMKQSEIAKELGIPENTVKSNILRAKSKIKESVIELDVKKGTRLYSVAPFMLLLFTDEVKACMVPKAISASVLSGTAVAEAAMVEGTVVNSATQVAAGVIMKKLIVGVVSTLLVTGGVAAAYLAHNAKDATSEETIGIIAETTPEETSYIEETTPEPVEDVEIISKEEMEKNIAYVVIKEKHSIYQDGIEYSEYSSLYEYDQFFNCIAKYDIDNDDETGNEKVVLACDYICDDAGSIIGLKSYSYLSNGEISVSDTTYEYEYDEQGRVVVESTYNSDTLINSVKYEYEDNTRKVIYKDGIYILYTLDENGQIISYKFCNEEIGMSYVLFYEYEYDENGNISKTHTYIGESKETSSLYETIEYDYMKTTNANLEKGVAVLMPDGTGRYFDSMTEEEKREYFAYVDKACFATKNIGASDAKVQWIRDNYGDCFKVAGINFVYDEASNNYVSNIIQAELHYIIDGSTYEIGTAYYQYCYYKLADYLGYYGTDCIQYGNDAAFNYFYILYENGPMQTHENVYEHNIEFFINLGCERYVGDEEKRYAYDFITPEGVPIKIDENGFILYWIQYSDQDSYSMVRHTLSEYYEFVASYRWSYTIRNVTSSATIVDEYGSIIDSSADLGSTEYKILLVNSKAPVD